MHRRKLIQNLGLLSAANHISGNNFASPITTLFHNQKNTKLAVSDHNHLTDRVLTTTEYRTCSMVQFRAVVGLANTNIL